MKKSIRLLSLLLVVLMVIFAFAACGKKEEVKEDNKQEDNKQEENKDENKEDDKKEEDKKDEGKPKKDSFTTAISSEPATLSVFEANDYVAWGVMNNIYDGLVTFEQDGSITPGLAEKWEYSADGKEITLHLRKDVKFHNGNAFNADDVVYTYGKQIGNSMTQNNTSAMEKMEKVDDYTVKLTLKYAYGPIEHCMGGFMTFIADKETHEKDPASYTRNPQGTGAYKVVSWDAGDKITLTRNDDYFLSEVPIKDVIYKIIPDTTTQVMALENHEIDYMDSVPVAELENIRGNKELGTVDASSPSTYFFCMNNSVAPFDNTKVRQAVAYALDRESIMIGAIGGEGVINNTPMAHNIVGWPGEDYKWLDQDVEKAKSLLKEAGFENGFKVTCLIMPSASYVKPAEIIQEQLRAIGIEMEIQTMERAAFLTDMVGNKNYVCSVMSATAFFPDSDYIYAQYHTGDLTSRNYVRCADPKLDALLEAARVETDKAKRNDLYLQICDLWKEECYMIPMYIQNSTSAFDADLLGVEDNANRKLTIRDKYWANVD